MTIPCEVVNMGFEKMTARLFCLTIILICTLIIGYISPLPDGYVFSTTFVLGFMLLSAYCTGFIFERIGLPRISGYIIAGLLFGPSLLSFYSRGVVLELNFLNSLALSFIAFCAGGELQLAKIRPKIKSILYLISGVSAFVFTGVTLAVTCLSGLISFMQPFDYLSRIAVAAIFGIICVARSPSSAIAIISETKARGDYTETVLSVTIVMDVIIIILFAVVMAICRTALQSDVQADLLLPVYLLAEMAVAMLVGFLLGKAIIFLIDRVKVEFPVVIAAMGYLVITFCHFLADYFHELYNFSLNLEPLLICMAAGFTVQNFSSHGTAFLQRMDRVSLPIYVAFFAITGAAINLEMLKTGWILGVVIVLTRTAMIYLGSYCSGRLAGDQPRIYQNTWLGFITQAGVSLGLLAEVVRRFPDFGLHVQNILIAAITINQLIGPVAFKYGLRKVGETHADG